MKLAAVTLGVGLVAGSAAAQIGEGGFSGDILPGISTEDLLEREVIASDGTEIGEIEDVLLAAEGLEATRVVFEAGGFLGIGERYVVVPIDELTVEPEREVATLGMTPEQIERLPVVEQQFGEWVEVE